MQDLECVDGVDNVNLNIIVTDIIHILSNMYSRLHLTYITFINILTNIIMVADVS